MRIGLLTTGFPREPEDPAGRFVLGFAASLAARGHAVDVLAPEPDRGAAPSRLEGVRVRWVPYLRPRHLERTFYGAGAPDNLRRDPWAWAGLAPYVASLAAHAAVAARGWDAVASHWLLPSALVAGALRRGRPHVAVCHSADLHLLRRLPGRRRLAEGLVRGASTLLFASAPLRDAFVALLPAGARDAAARCHVQPMGFDPVAPGPGGRVAARWALGLGPDAPVALCLSRLVPIKGVDVAIDAVARCAAPVTLLVAGDGPEAEALRARAAPLGHRVRFLGEVRGGARTDAFAAADVFVAPSRPLDGGRTEGTPTAALEAMSAGLPVVASRTGGLPDVVGDAGALVAPEDAAALAAALDRLAGRPGERARLGAAARARSAPLAWDAVGPRLARWLGEPPGRLPAGT